jgi:hypothetical protein
VDLIGHTANLIALEELVRHLRIAGNSQ